MIDVSKWEKIERTGLDSEKINRLIDACTMAHRDALSIGLACGIRCAFRLLAEIGGDRTKRAVRHIKLTANSCSSLAFMIICCVNVCKGNMEFSYSARTDWQVEGTGEHTWRSDPHEAGGVPQRRRGFQNAGRRAVRPR